MRHGRGGCLLDCVGAGRAWPRHAMPRRGTATRGGGRVWGVWGVWVAVGGRAPSTQHEVDPFNPLGQGSCTCQLAGQCQLCSAATIRGRVGCIAVAYAGVEAELRLHHTKRGERPEGSADSPCRRSRGPAKRLEPREAGQAGGARAGARRSRPDRCQRERGGRQDNREGG